MKRKEIIKARLRIEDEARERAIDNAKRQFKLDLEFVEIGGYQVSDPAVEYLLSRVGHLASDAFLRGVDTSITKLLETPVEGREPIDE